MTTKTTTSNSIPLYNIKCSIVLIEELDLLVSIIIDFIKSFADTIWRYVFLSKLHLKYSSQYNIPFNTIEVTILHVLSINIKTISLKIVVQIYFPNFNFHSLQKGKVKWWVPWVENTAKNHPDKHFENVWNNFLNSF